MYYKGQDLKPGSPHTFTFDTPLVFQWLPRRYGHPIPEKYLRRLSEWAKREDTRVVKLVINGSGFTLRQREELEDKISNREFNLNKNIELIDFNELDLREYEFSFHYNRIRKLNCLNVLNTLYLNILKIYTLFRKKDYLLVLR